MAAEEHNHESSAESHGSHGGGHAKHGGGHGGGHDEGHEGAPEWLISFADNVTLMMGFFVIMLALTLGAAKTSGQGNGGPGAQESTPNLLDLAMSIRDAFNNPVRADSDDPNEQLLVRRLLQRQGQEKIDVNGVPGKSHKLQSLRPTDYEAIGAVIPFEADSSALTGEAKTLVEDISSQLRGLKLVINIRAHCSVAEAASAKDQGLQLCFDRAYSVASALHDRGLDWNQVRLQVCGATERIEEHAYTPSAHGRNQRVEVAIDDKVAQPDAIKPTPAATQEHD